jgi:beta-glucosidase
LIFSPGTDFSGRSDAGFTAAVEAARRVDVVILALGEQGTTMSGEASSRATLGLPGNQQQLLEQIAATGKPVILVLFNGRPLALPWAATHVPAILEAWYPGIEAGPALADVLFGDVNPSGKLPAEMARSVGQEPLYYAQLPTGRPAPELDFSQLPANPPKRYDSSYIDEGNTPLFPFGWGLSYTNFQYSAIRVTHEASPDNSVGIFHISADVTNTGTIAGTEVAQLYIRDAVASVEQPERELKGFRRVSLAPGESRHLEFDLGFDDLAFYNSDLKRVVEPGHFDVWVGGNSLAAGQAGFDVGP